MGNSIAKENSPLPPCNVLKLTKECQNIQRDEQTRETVRHVSEHPRMRSACFNRMMQYSVPVSNVSSSDYVTDLKDTKPNNRVSRNVMRSLFRGAHTHDRHRVITTGAWKMRFAHRFGYANIIIHLIKKNISYKNLKRKRNRNRLGMQTTGHPSIIFEYY